MTNAQESVGRIRQTVSIADVLDYFGIEHRNNRSACPVHEGDNLTAFSFNDEVYYCHTHGCKGDVFTLVQHLARTDFRGALSFLSRIARRSDFTGPRSPIDLIVPLLNRPRLPDWLIEELKSELLELSELQRIFTTKLRGLRNRHKQGKLSPEDLYIREQLIDEFLEELDQDKARLNYRVHVLQRKGRQKR